jgi:hypothetical protein
VVGGDAVGERAGALDGLATRGQQVHHVRTAIGLESAADGLTSALSGGQVSGAQQAATAARGPSAGQRAYDLAHRVGTSAVVDALTHVTLISAVIAFASGVLSLLLIRQKDFVTRGVPQGAEPDAHQLTDSDSATAGQEAGLS